MSLEEDLKNKKPIIGFDVAVKNMKNGSVSVVYVASNFLSLNRLRLLSKTSKVNLVELKEDSKKLGMICKKPFTISVISFK